MRAGHRQRSQFVNLTQTDGLHYHSAAAPVQLRLTVDNKQGTVNELEVDILEVHPMRHRWNTPIWDNVRANFCTVVVENKYLSNQAKFCNLYIMVKVKVEAMKEDGSSSCTNGLL
ncbi:hypothetical protein Tco_1541928 [Tanacetum coccineum]